MSAEILICSMLKKIKSKVSGLNFIINKFPKTYT